jgi:hypothetical protein
LRDLSYDSADWVATEHKTDNEGNKLKKIQFGLWSVCDDMPTIAELSNSGYYN